MARLDTGRFPRSKEVIQENNTNLGVMILAERTRSQKEIEQVKKEDDSTDFDRNEVEFEDIQRSVPILKSFKRDGTVRGDNREVFIEIFGSIFGQFSSCQQQIIRDNSLDLMIWESFNVEIQELFVDRSFKYISRYAP